MCEYPLIGCQGREKVENYGTGWQNHRALGGRDLERLDQSTNRCFHLLYTLQGTLPLQVAGFPWGSYQEQRVLVVGQNLPPGSFSNPRWPTHAVHIKQTDFLNVSTLNMLRNILHCPYVILRVFLSSNLEIPSSLNSSSYELPLICP